VHVRVRLRAPSGSVVLTAVAAGVATAMVAYVATRRIGTEGLLAPLALVLVGIVLMRPVLAVALLLTVAIVFEGIVGAGAVPSLYAPLSGRVSPFELLVVLVLVAIAGDVLRARRPLRAPPRPLSLALALLALAMCAGVVTALGNGVGTRTAIEALRVLLMLLLLPLAIVNLDLDQRQIKQLLALAAALGIAKAIAGLVLTSSGGGLEIEDGATLTYYEPAANWVMLVAIVAVVAALLQRMRPPLWLLLGTPLLVASLVLSYRRSFWIAAVFALLLVLLLSTTPSGRRMLVPASLLVAGAIWVLGSTGFQAQTPLGQRIASLSPSRLTTNKSDRYRIDERANVLGELRRHPISGLGLKVPWAASVQPLPVEYPNGRDYVHFAPLWWWLKMGILGLVAYFAVIGSGVLLAWRTWRLQQDRLLAAFGIGSACALLGLMVMDTTASFTGVDVRLTVLLGVQLGVIATLSSGGEPAAERPAPRERAVVGAAAG